MRLVLGLVVLACLWAYRLGRAVVAGLGLAAWLGTGWAVTIAVLSVALRLHWVLRVAAFLTLLLVWHWPWWVALPLAAPRLFLLLPGWIQTLTARRRHPRPLWPAPATGR
jgi:hypothetical protein